MKVVEKAADLVKFSVQISKLTMRQHIGGHCRFVYNIKTGGQLTLSRRDWLSQVYLH